MTGVESPPAGTEAGPLEAAWGRLAAGARERPDGLVEAREEPQREPRPDPLEAGDARVMLEALARGLPWREAFEELLWALPKARREALTQVRKESRGAWALLLEARAGTALFVGNGLAGTVVPLAALGLGVTVLDGSPERLLLGVHMARYQVAGRVRGVVGGDGSALPFEDGQFDVVVSDEEELDDARLAELRRVCRGELFVAVDNRLGYKRSSGRAWDFHVPHPFAYARSVLRPPHGRRTLHGWRRALAGPGFERPAALALYPDRRDFAQVVAIEADRPRLFVGPNEARNRLKVAAHALGLFPVLAPSFGLRTRRSSLAPAPARVERLLDALAERTGEPRPRVEHLVGTRGDTCVVMTEVPGAAPADPRGRWVLHMPLHLPHRRGMKLHFLMLQRVRERWPDLPVPDPLFEGELDGLFLTCERRLPGWASNHVLTDRAAADRILEQIADHAALLVLRSPRPFSEEDFERVVAPWYEATLRGVRDQALRADLGRRREQARRLLVGRELPLVFAHGDMRAKHVQVDSELTVTGYMDWGTVMEEALPGLELIHRIVHDRKQILGQRDGEAWREVCDPQRLMPGERGALERYARKVGMEPLALQAVAEVYPVYVTAIVDRYTPYLRPDWFRNNFGI